MPLRKHISTIAALGLVSLSVAAVHDVYLDPTASSATNRATYLAGFSGLASGDTVAVHGIGMGTQVVYMDFAAVNLSGLSSITVAWDANLTATVPSGTAVKSVLLRFDNAPSLHLDGLTLDGNTDNTDPNVAFTGTQYIYGTDGLVFVKNCPYAQVNNVNLKNTALFGILANSCDGIHVTGGTITHIRCEAVELRSCNRTVDAVSPTIELLTASDQFDFPTSHHTLELYSCSYGVVDGNHINSITNEAIQTTACNNSSIVNNVGSNIGGNAYKDDGGSGTNYFTGNTFTNVGNSAMVFGGSTGLSSGTWYIDNNTWTNLAGTYQPDGTWPHWKIYLMPSQRSTQNGFAPGSVFNFTNNTMDGFTNPSDQSAIVPRIFTSFTMPAGPSLPAYTISYNVTGNTFKQETANPLGKVFMPGEEPSPDTTNHYINTVAQ